MKSFCSVLLVALALFLVGQAQAGHTVVVTKFDVNCRHMWFQIAPEEFQCVKCGAFYRNAPGVSYGVVYPRVQRVRVRAHNTVVIRRR
jgi:hypothetical protein